MRQRRGKKLLSFVLALAMALGQAPAVGVAAFADTASDVEYVYYADEAAAVAQTATSGKENCTKVVSSVDPVTWTTGWYVVEAGQEAVTIGAPITVQGDVHLVLCDGATLNATKGITVPDEAGEHSLTVYGQSDGAGSLFATSNDDYGQAIGNSVNGNELALTVNGGTVQASCTVTQGTGIYGALTVNGGTVVAEGEANGVDGLMGSSEGVTVNGGSLTATSTGTVSGISCKGPFVVNGGTVTATGASGENVQGFGIQSFGSVKIGGGEVSASGQGGISAVSDVTVIGGKVTADGKEASGISSSSGSVTFSGGEVIATSGDNNAVFGWTSVSFGGTARVTATTNAGSYAAVNANSGPVSIGDYAHVTAKSNGRPAIDGGGVTISGSANVTATTSSDSEAAICSHGSPVTFDGPVHVTAMTNAASAVGFWGDADKVVYFKEGATGLTGDSAEGMTVVATGDGGKVTTPIGKILLLPVEHSHEDVNGQKIEFKPWLNASSLPDTAGDHNYFLAVDVTLTNTWSVPTGVTNLCLDGHTITGNIETGTSPVIDVSQGSESTVTSTLNLYDCSGTSAGKVVRAKQGAAGQEAIQAGSCVVRVGNNSADNTFSLAGGTITGGEIGVNVWSAKFAMSGGEVSGNKIGVTFLNTGGTIELSGSPVIKDNKAGSGGTTANLDLTSGQKVTVVGPMAPGASVGVTMGTPGVFTSGWETVMGQDAEPAGFFTSDAAGLGVCKDGSEAKLGDGAAITYVLNGGAFVTGYAAPGSYVKGVSVTLPAADKLSRSGYSFDGWYKNPELTDGPISSIGASEENAVTLYAKWSPRSSGGGSRPRVDKTKLREEAATAGGLEPSDYTEATAAALGEALTAAQAVLDDPRATQSQVNAALQALKDAEAALVRRADKSALQEEAAKAEEIDRGPYTDESLAQLDRALADAKAALDDPDATQAQVDDARSALEGAEAALVERADKSALQEEAAKAEAIDRGPYTDESLALLDRALADAQAVLADANATQAQVDAARSALRGAEEALAPKPDGWRQAEDGTWSYLRGGVRATGWMQDDAGDWYHFGADGVMDTGWLLDADGSWYYLSTEHDGRFGHLLSGWVWDQGFWYYLSEAHDGSFGRMLTGWQLIGGDWYYLREHTGDPLGSCALDTVIDGWRVDASGRWVA